MAWKKPRQLTGPVPTQNSESQRILGVSPAFRMLSRDNPTEKHHPHFLGAVVLQQVQKKTGQMQERTIIDGQQRLTTLQLLLDALHAELLAVGAVQSAMRLDALVVNPPAFCELEEDQF